MSISRPPIDLRSDTVTRPTPAMRRAMAEAEVGDDVYGEDPTVAALERRTAELFGKEAALFVPSGTMANQVAIGAHVAPGDEVLCGSTAHVYVWEGGGIARLSGATARPIEGDGGLLDLAALEGKVRPDNVHYVRTRLVCLENTHNRAGGRVHPIESVAEIAAWARSNGLAMHLDGARVMNAAVASGHPARDWAAHFDTVSICFSKGLGAPVGSALAGPADLIQKAHRLRKVFGGGMRQAGVIAAAALHALEHHVERLAEDHANAQVIARAVEATKGLALESGPVETNLVWVAVDPALGTAAEVAARLQGAGVLVSALGPQVFRVCTHLDVSREQVEIAAAAIRALSPSPPGSSRSSADLAGAREFRGG
jgi:threonine aldolase